jgi:hypothetical protein
MAKEVTKKSEVKEEAVETKSEKPAKKAVRKFAADDLISCRSITYGELLLTGPKSRLLYTWSNYGDVTEMEYQDLQALKSTKSSYLYRPRFIIEDEELVELWARDFKDMYDGIVEVDVEDMFSLPLNQFKAKLKKAPKGVQQAVKNIAGEKIMNGTLDSLKKIKAIDEILGTDLRLYIE